MLSIPFTAVYTIVYACFPFKNEIPLPAPLTCGVGLSGDFCVWRSGEG